MTNELMTAQGLTIPEETTQDQWVEIHRTIITAKRAAGKWLSESRKWATGKWGIDFVAETEVQLELALGIEAKEKPPAINPPDKSRAIVTIEGIAQSFSLWHRKMEGEVRDWDRPRCEAALRLIEPIARLADELRAKLEGAE
jgi:hypothetical protein